MISNSGELRYRYCSEPIENIENYDKAMADKEHIWVCHHRAEVLPCGIYTVAQLQKYGLYWHRPAYELIFLPRSEHRRLHKTNNPFQSTPIEMTTLSDGMTKKFPSLGEAERWLHKNGYPKSRKSAIHACCNGKQDSAYGAKWRYL